MGLWGRVWALTGARPWEGAPLQGTPGASPRPGHCYVSRGRGGNLAGGEIIRRLGSIGTGDLGHFAGV